MTTFDLPQFYLCYHGNDAVHYGWLYIRHNYNFSYQAVSTSQYSCLSKFSAAILNQRLLNIAQKSIIPQVHKNQLCFMHGNRFSDALIILYNPYVKYCKQKTRYIFGCFVDFSKAFDTIQRLLLFKKLSSYNIIVNITVSKTCTPMTQLSDQSRGKTGVCRKPLLFTTFDLRSTNCFESL